MGLFGFGKKKLSPQEAYEEAKRCFEAEDYDNALEPIMDAAEDGLAEAQYMLGRMYHLGCGGLRSDEKEAVAWYEAAAMQGYVKAQHCLGVIYYWDSFGRKDGEKNGAEAIHWLTLAVEGGETGYADSLGTLYAEGRGCGAKNMEKALEIWTREAGRGHTGCMMELGDYYRDLCQKDEALKWYLLAEPHVRSDYIVEHMKEQDEVLAAAAENGYIPAQYELAWMLAMGKDREQDIEAAKKWAQKAAAAGHKEAEALLEGLKNPALEAMQQRINGDDELAFKWYYVAAVQGESYAQSYVAGYYKDGLGVEKNLDEAEKWYLRAIEGGWRYDQFNLGMVYFEKSQYDEAIEMFLPSAEEGNLDAMFNIGLCYWRWRFEADAEEWYLRAAEKGHQEAMWNLAVLYERWEEWDDAWKWACALKKAGHEKADEMLENISRLGKKDHWEAPPETKADPQELRKEEKRNPWEESCIQTRAVAEEDAEEVCRQGEAYLKDGETEKGLYWLETAAANGSGKAAYLLSEHWRKEESGTFPQTLHWLELSADLEYPEGCARLAWTLATAQIGVEVDLKRARVLAQRAADAGYKTGAYIVKNMDCPLEAGEKEYQEGKKVVARCWFRVSAESGDSAGMVRLAQCYLNGEGAKQNMEKAKFWLEKAEQLGNSEAAFQLEQIAQMES